MVAYHQVLQLKVVMHEAQSVKSFEQVKQLKTNCIGCGFAKHLVFGLLLEFAQVWAEGFHQQFAAAVVLHCAVQEREAFRCQTLFHYFN